MLSRSFWLRSKPLATVAGRERFRAFSRLQNSSFLGVSAKNVLLQEEHYLNGSAKPQLQLAGESGGSQRRLRSAPDSPIPDIYHIRQELAKKFDAQNDSRLRSRFTKLLVELRSLSKKYISNRSTWHTKGNSARLEHDITASYSSCVMKLRPRFFVLATSEELVELLSIGTAMRSNSSHVVHGTVQVLLRRIGELKANQLAVVIHAVAEVKDGGLSPNQKTQLLVAFFAQLLRFPEKYVSEMSVKRATALVGLGLKDSIGEGCVPDGMSRDFLACVLQVYGADVVESKRWRVRDVALICAAVVHHKMATDQAVTFFKTAAPLCIECVSELNPKQISQILLAFATVRYHDVKLFLTLGQRAGDLGEIMSEDDAARIIRAFEMTKIGFEPLRNSLESAMRLRNIHRAPLSSTGGL